MGEHRSDGLDDLIRAHDAREDVLEHLLNVIEVLAGGQRRRLPARSSGRPQRLS
jgi:hypothetical protein